MQIAIPVGASYDQIAEELKASLGNLVTDEDVIAFLSNLPENRDGPLLGDIYQLYQEILARYQTRLHSDDRVWRAEIGANNIQGALAAHIAEYGETLDCSGRIQTTDATVCQRRETLERDAEAAMESYIDTQPHRNAISQRSTTTCLMLLSSGEVVIWKLRDFIRSSILKLLLSTSPSMRSRPRSRAISISWCMRRCPMPCRCH